VRLIKYRSFFFLIEVANRSSFILGIGGCSGTAVTTFSSEIRFCENPILGKKIKKNIKLKNKDEFLGKTILICTKYC
jgi:hypothetical protein